MYKLTIQSIQSPLGNERFRDEIIEPRKATYNTTISYKQKGVIAQDCYDEAKQRGARFLKLVKTTGRLARNVVETGTWIEVSKREALEKCKQSLREKFVAKSTQMHKRQGRFKLMSIKPPSSDTKNDSESLPTCTQSNNEGRPSGTSAVIDSPTKASDRSGSTSLGPGGASRESLKVVIKAPSSAGPSLNKFTPIADDEREAALALAGLATSLAKHPKLPKEQDEMAAQRTATNRRSVATAHQRKRARNDMDKETLSFLVGQMRFQIETIPPENKQVFHEAQVRCRHNGGAEFSDERLECFLRVGGMNPTIAAQRFIEYWNARREVFGNNFTRRLTLSEALKDDIPALRASVIRVLPHKDVYGRQLVLLEPRRNTGGYTPESLVSRSCFTLARLSSFPVLTAPHTRSLSRFQSFEPCGIPQKFCRKKLPIFIMGSFSSVG